MQVEHDGANLAPNAAHPEEKKTIAPPLKASVKMRGREVCVTIDVPDCVDESVYDIGKTGEWVSKIADIVARICVDEPTAVMVKFAGHTGARGHLLSQLLLVPQLQFLECVHAHPIFSDHINRILRIPTLVEVGLPFSNPRGDRLSGVHSGLYGVVDRQRLLACARFRLLRFWDFDGSVSSAFLCDAVRAFASNTKLKLAMCTSATVVAELQQLNTALCVDVPVECADIPETAQCVLTGSVYGFKVAPLESKSDSGQQQQQKAQKQKQAQPQQQQPATPVAAALLPYQPFTFGPAMRAAPLLPLRSDSSSRTSAAAAAAAAVRVSACAVADDVAMGS